MILYRPVGHKELELICESGLLEFPPRLPEQPIFYPVLNAQYAREIAEGWNTKSDTFAGYITRFIIDNEYAQKFQGQIVGGKQHEELWVPAEELEKFNKNIFGHIEVIAAYFGEGFIGSSPSFGFRNQTASADEYLQMLLDTLEYNYGDFRAAIILNYRSVFCNYAYWKQLGINRLKTESDIIQSLVPGIVGTWLDNFPGINLPTEAKILEFETV